MPLARRYTEKSSRRGFGHGGFGKDQKNNSKSPSVGGGNWRTINRPNSNWHNRPNNSNNNHHHNRNASNNRSRRSGEWEKITGKIVGNGLQKTWTLEHLKIFLTVCQELQRVSLGLSIPFILFLKFNEIHKQFNLY